MSNQIQGLVMEINKRYCIIMTQTGEFHRVPKPAQPVELGTEITCRLGTGINWLRNGALAAILVVIMIGCSLYQSVLPTAVAYVSLDINPSVEIGVDQNSQVVEVQGLNDDGKELLKMVSLKKKNVYTAIEELIAASIQNDYLDAEKENLVFVAVTKEPTATLVVVEEKLVYETIANSITAIKAPVEVLVTEAKPEVQKEAHKIGVSTGKYLLYLDAVQTEPEIPVKSLNKQSLKDLGVKQWEMKHPSSPKRNLNQVDDQKTITQPVITDENNNNNNNNNNKNNNKNNNNNNKNNNKNNNNNNKNPDRKSDSDMDNSASYNPNQNLNRPLNDSKEKDQSQSPLPPKSDFERNKQIDGNN